MPLKYRDIMKRLEEGWYIDRTRGSHRQYKHPAKPGVVTVPGRPNEGLSTWNVPKHLQASGVEKVKEYAAIFEKTATGYSAYCPDLPGLASCGSSWEEAQQMLGEALAFHLEGMVRDGQALPESTTRVLMMHAEVVGQELAKTA